MLVKCLAPYIPIYFQPFVRYSKLLVENCDIFIHHLCLAAPQGVTPSKFCEDLDTHKTRTNGLSTYRVVKKAWQYVQPFWYNTSVWQTDRRTERRTDVQSIAIRASAWLTHVKTNKKDGYRQRNVRQFLHILASPAGVRPWDNRDKCYMDGKRIQCWSNASQHIPIYL